MMAVENQRVSDALQGMPSVNNTDAREEYIHDILEDVVQIYVGSLEKVQHECKIDLADDIEYARHIVTIEQDRDVEPEWYDHSVDKVLLLNVSWRHSSPP